MPHHNDLKLYKEKRYEFYKEAAVARNLFYTDATIYETFGETVESMNPVNWD